MKRSLLTRFATAMGAGLLALVGAAQADDTQRVTNRATQPSGRAFLDPRLPGVFLADPEAETRTSAEPAVRPANAEGSPSGAAFLDPRLAGVFLVNPGDSSQPKTAKDYWTMVVATIKGGIAYPSDLKAAAEATGSPLPSGKAVLIFSIGKDGALRDDKLQTSSGDRRLDEAALAGLRGAAPFPAPPDEVADKPATLPVSFAAPPIEKPVTPEKAR